MFEADGRYTIKAWAEDDDGTRISPQASIELSVLEGEFVTNSNYDGYIAEGVENFGQRDWGEEDADSGITLTVYGLSIQKE